MAPPATFIVSSSICRCIFGYLMPQDPQLLTPPPLNVRKTKLKVQLKLAIARLRMVQQRDEALSKAQRRSMAQLLEAGKFDSARIRVENIIRSDIITELHELLELYCELLLARAGLFEGPTCDPGMEEAVKSVMYAAPKTEIKELQTVRLMLAEKYGKEFALQAIENSDGKVNDKVVKKLSVTPPRPELVQGYLEEIAMAYGVDWPPHEEKAEVPENLIDDGDDDFLGDSDGEGGGLKEQPILAVSASMKDLMDMSDDGGDGEDKGLPTPPRETKPSVPLVVNPPSPSTENIHPRVTLNSVALKPSKKMVDAGMTKKKKSGEEELDDLAKRFEALKKP
ncbi:IST1-like protein [Zalerion maritima]|uniref:IST1-like protein n=1 Tax=Zalerion maritima TaxID=339359 RepID=A0AAD5RVH8_9PEZI|nr:IST1-like protein [Zalerion maritima]